MRHDPMLMISSDMINRIERLHANCATMSLPDLCDALNEIRHRAASHQLDAIEQLASMLCSMIAYNGHRQIALTYLDLMRDAAQGTALDPQATQTFLAAAAVRGCR